MTQEQHDEHDRERQMNEQPGVQPELQPLLQGQLAAPPAEGFNLVDCGTNG